jgi:nickel transport system permease protein
MSMLGLAPRPDRVLGGRAGQDPRNLWSALVRHRNGRIGLTLALLLALVAILGPLFVDDPDQTDYAHQLRPPSWAHPLGTDQAGRDLLARAVAGARTSLSAAVLVMVVATVLGLAIGVLAGFAGGWIDTVLDRFTDVMLGLPGMVLTLAIVGLLGPGFVNLVLAMSISSWAGLAKLARTYSRGAGSRPDVIAARMAGAGRLRIAVGHVLPAASSLVIIASTLGLGDIVLALGGLSFLGLGAQPPTAEWGNMLSDSRGSLAIAPFQLIGPGAGLVLTVLAATLISDALRDVSSPGDRS